MTPANSSLCRLFSWGGHLQRVSQNFYITDPSRFFYIIIIDRHLALIFYYFFLIQCILYIFACKFTQESQSDVLGWVIYIWHASSALARTWACIPWKPTVLTRVRCLSLKADLDREVRSHPDSRISAKVKSWELGLSKVMRPDDHRKHPELRHVSSLHYRLRNQSCATNKIKRIVTFIVK